VSALGPEAPRPLRKAGDTDAVTFTWADAGAGVYGLARVASGLLADGRTSHSVLAVGFAGREVLGAIAEAGETPPPQVAAAIEEPLERWTVRAAGEVEFELEFTATTPPAEYGGRIGLVKTGGMEGYEQLCRVRGTMAGRAVDGVGQRGHSWGNPDWDKIVLTRSVSAWFEDASGCVLSTVRSVKASSHADEASWAAAYDGTRFLTVEEPRLSTTTDAAGRQIRASLELWMDADDDYPTRGLGEVLTGSTLELGALRLDIAFFAWHIEGRAALGRYDIIRHA
jgi:hypothetical protein